MRTKLERVSAELAENLRKWEPDLLLPYSIERKQGPKYFTSVYQSDGWDVISYYTD
tara:strand:- start:106 stop:273 length:168 start_codon:yes stop_codon:yes gene_type:complete